MKLLILFIACTVIIYCHCEMEKLKVVSNKYSALADSVERVLSQILIKEIAIVNVITPGNISSFAILDFKRDFLSKSFLEAKISFRQDASKSITKTLVRRKRICIFPIERFDDFIEINKELNGKVFRINGYYIVVLLNGEIEEIEEMFKLFWNIQIFTVIVIFEDEDGAIVSKSFMPFTSRSCNDTAPVFINKFKDEKLINGSRNYLPNKMRNLRKCPLKVAVATNNEPCTFTRLLANGSYLLSGLSIDLMKTLAETLNFNLIYSYVGPEGYLLENGTTKGSLRALLEGEAEMAIASLWLMKNRSAVFEPTTSYISDSINLIIPPGKKYTAFEKLVFPFSLLSWIVISTSCTVGILIIFVLKFCSSTIQNFVFGTGVKYPHLNMFIAVIGGVQNILPKRNFARFLLACFLLYALVLRTLYQGSYYQFLRTNKLHKTIDSVEEMVENNFMFYVPQAAVNLFLQIEAIKNR